MTLARVLDEVVASRKHPSHQGRKILLVQPEDAAGAPRGEPLLALDAVDAGVGERVLVVMEGYAAMTAVGRPNSPTSAAIVGIVDEVSLAPE